MAGRRVVLIDGSALVFRAFYALPQSLRSSSGLQTNAIYGFATMFRKVLSGRSIAWGAVVFDAPGPNFRHAIDSAYKAQRPAVPSELSAQFEPIERLVAGFGFPVLRVPGVEADDVIGTLARRAEANGDDVVIVSGDKDFCQLVSPSITLLEPLRDVSMDIEWVRKRWGVRPDQFADVLAMMGDSVDNIPGVPGIGAKGAAKLLGQYDSLAGILDNVESLKGRQKSALLEHAEQARRSLALATIRTDVEGLEETDDLAIRELPDRVLRDLFTEFEFFSLLTEAPEQPVTADVVDLGDLTAAEAFLADLDASVVGLVVVTTGPSAVRGSTKGLALGQQRVGWLDLSSPSPGRDRVAQWLADPESAVVVCGLRDALSALARLDMPLEGVEADIGLASFLLDPTADMPHGHAQVVRRALQRPAAALDQEVARGRSLNDVAPERMAAVAGQMALEVREAWSLLELRLREANQYDLMAEHELPLSYVLAGMQDLGIGVDAAVLTSLQDEFVTRRDAIAAQIHAAAGRVFNPGSLAQLGTVLFDELELPVLKRTKTGYSTDASVLERLRHEHPIAGLVLRWRSLAKLVNTYTRVLREAIAEDGRIHPTYGQTTSVSGRLICTEPDLQRTPIRTEDGRRIRDAFVAKPGCQLVSADWSQIELRLLAHITGDPVLVSAFQQGADVHARTAAGVFHVAEEDVTPEQRRVGKTVNFATLYGQGASALAIQIGVPRGEAKAMIAAYFDCYAGVRRWMDETSSHACETGFCDTLLGRRRRIRELSSKNPQTRSYGERIAANTPIQGSAADLCKRAMLRLDEALIREGLAARMVLQIHDELLFEAPDAEVDRVCALARKHMEGVYPLDVPLVVNIGVGRTWLEAHS